MICSNVEVPVGDLPEDAVVTGFASIEAADGWARYHRQPPPERYEFASQKLKDLLAEFDNIEKYRKDRVVASVQFTKIEFPSGK